MTILADGAALKMQAASGISQSVTGQAPANVSMAKGHFVRRDAAPFAMPRHSPLDS